MECGDLAGSSWWGERKHGMTVSCSDNEVWKMLSIFASEDFEDFVFLKYLFTTVIKYYGLSIPPHCHHLQPCFRALPFVWHFLGRVHGPPPPQLLPLQAHYSAY